MYRLHNIDPSRQVSSISANFIHSQDATHMRMVIRKFKKDMVTVHDSFGCHAGNYFELNKIVRKQFVKLYKNTDPFEPLNVMNEMNVDIEKGEFDVEEVIESTYFFS